MRCFLTRLGALVVVGVVVGSSTPARALERELQLNTFTDVSVLRQGGDLFHGLGVGAGVHYGWLDWVGGEVDLQFRSFSGVSSSDGRSEGEIVYDLEHYLLTTGLYTAWGYPWTVTGFVGFIFGFESSRNQARLDGRGILVEHPDDALDLRGGVRAALGIERRLFHEFALGFSCKLEAPLSQSATPAELSGPGQLVVSGNLIASWYLYP